MENNKAYKNIWFPELRPPDESNKKAFIDFWKKEKERCIDGFTIADGQVYISGWLYWHTVYWTIELDEKFTNPITGKETSRKVKGTPTFRDNEWIIANDLERAEREKGLYIVTGSRGYGKSFSTASIQGRTYTFFDDSETLITGGNSGDIKKLAEKIDLGLAHVHPVFHKQRLKNDWKLEVRAGWIDKETGLPKGTNSRILIRNYNNGEDTMATNGTRPLCQVIEESGKIPNLIPCVLDSLPSWMNDFGFFSVVILIGTGGDAQKGEDFGKIFNNPETYYGLGFDDIWEGKGKIGRFFPVTLCRNEYKEDWTLYDFLKTKYPKEYGNLTPHKDLDIIIKVSNEEEVMEKFVKPRREKAAKALSSIELTKERAYYPIVPSECFLKIAVNDYPLEACKEQADFLDSSDYQPERIKLYLDLNGQLKWEHTNDTPVEDFPVSSGTNKKGVIQMIEPPIENAPEFTYCAGLDPYKISESNYSTSIGSLYIFKRRTDKLGEVYQDMPVAWYSGRPSNINEFYENCRLLLKFYNATCMMENADMGFKDYMELKGELHYLAKGQSITKEINVNSNTLSVYGMTPSVANINYWNNNAVLYTKEIFQKTEDGTEHLGVKRILDRMLLEEMMKDDGEINTDRIRAFSIAVSYAKQLDTSIGKVRLEEHNEIVKQKKIIQSPFFTNILQGSNGLINKSPFL